MYTYLSIYVDLDYVYVFVFKRLFLYKNVKTKPLKIFL